MNEGDSRPTNFKETPNANKKCEVDRSWARRSKIERETAQIVRQGP
jgi:hypothetical protein